MIEALGCRISQHSDGAARRLVATGATVAVVASTMLGVGPAAASDAAGQPISSVRLVSASPDGEAPDADSVWSAASADGRFVAFVSKATGLVPGLVCSNQFHHLYLQDRTAGTTTLVDVRPDGQCGNRSVQEAPPSISADGRQVAFASNATDLTAVGAAGLDVFVRDTVAGTTTTASVAPDGKRVDGESRAPDLSADGSTVVFESLATDLVPAVPPGIGPPIVHIYRRDLGAGVTTLVSATPAGLYADRASALPSVSGDGRLVTYYTGASDIVPVLGPFLYNVLLFDVPARTTTVVSATPTGEPPDGGSFVPAISADGATIAFRSDAENLVPGDGNKREDIFSYDVATAVATMVTWSRTGGWTNGISRYADISADGTRIAFTSFASNLVARDRNDESDVFVYDSTTGSTTLVSRTKAVRSANGDSSGYWRPAISGDGALVLFSSNATNLVHKTAGLTRPTFQLYGFRVS